jgi:hypothetical protein
MEENKRNSKNALGFLINNIPIIMKNTIPMIMERGLTGLPLPVGGVRYVIKGIPSILTPASAAILFANARVVAKIPSE